MQISFNGYEKIKARHASHGGHSWLDITSDRTGEMELTIHEGTLTYNQLRRIAEIINESARTPLAIVLDDRIPF